MKKLLALLLSLSLVVTLAACSENAPAETTENTTVATEAQTEAETTEETEGETESDSTELPAPEIKEAVGVTIPEFSVNVNGVDVTNVTLADLALYEVTAHSINSAGTTSVTTYIGFTVKDILAASGIEATGAMVVTADDGYEIEYSAEVANADTTLLAVSKNGEQFGTAPWLAPCSEQVTGQYLKNAITISFDGAESGTSDEEPAEDADAEVSEVPAPEKSDKTAQVTFSDYSFLIDGTPITNATLEGLSIYKVDASTLKDDAVTTSTYTGYVLSDVLAAAGITDFTSIVAVANDGYEVEYDKETAMNEFTIVAIEKDKELGEDGTIWIAPATETAGKMYAKLVVELKINK